MLTQWYWENLILETLGTAEISHIVQNHKTENLFCNFMEKSKLL